MANVAKRRSSAFWLHSVTREKRESRSGIPKAELKDWEHWDSVMEYKCYLHLLSLREKLGFSIQRQFKIDILPQALPFPGICWNVDFLLKFPNDLIIPVEVKGQWLLYDKGELKAFTLLIRMLSMHNPLLFDRLILLADSCWLIPATQLQIYDYKVVEQCLLMKVNK